MKAGPASAQVDVWWVALEDFTEAEASLALAVLSGDERTRHDAFRVETARAQFLAARALLRTTLSRYRDVAPADWSFETSGLGRPVIRGEAAGTLHFSVSHTHGVVACAVAAFAEVGVDVEWRGRDVGYAELVSSVLAPAEAARLAEVPEAHRADRFLTLWTLKEAYAKARGMGLSLSFAEIAFDIGDGVATARFGDALGDDASRWDFRVGHPTPRHVMSVAGAPPPGTGCRVLLRRTRAINVESAE